MVSESATTKDIQELKGVMRRKPIAREGGPIEDRILKLLIYGGQQMHDAQIKLGGSENRWKSSEDNRKRKRGCGICEENRTPRKMQLRTLSMIYGVCVKRFRK